MCTIMVKQYLGKNFLRLSRWGYNELYMILKCIINTCKPPQNFEFLETELSYRFIWFEKFWSRSAGVYDWLSIFCFILHYCFIFYGWPVKTCKKHQYGPTRTHKNSYMWGNQNQNFPRKFYDCILLFTFHYQKM